MAIGNQGHVGGNDFELLAATRWSLSVDRCSSRSDPLLEFGPIGPKGACGTDSLSEGAPETTPRRSATQQRQLSLFNGARLNRCERIWQSDSWRQ